ncbi:MAG: ATP-binding cassette domain-containing protein [Candidatus Eisenbacteria bacterium]
MIRLTAVEAAPRGAARSAKPAVGPIDFTIERGERHLILGANGAGKTTLLRVLAGLVPQRAGEVSWEWLRHARPAAMDGTTLWPHVAALFETPDAQFLGETVTADIAFGLEGLGLTASDLRGRVDESLQSFGLTPFATRDPRTLSAGEKARALLAAALAARPSCLLLDQTLAHLDPGSRRALETRLAREAEKGKFAIVRAHQEAEAPFDGERLHLLERGLLREAGALEGDSVRAARSLPLPLGLRVSAALAARGLWRGPLTADLPGLLGELRLRHQSTLAPHAEAGPHAEADARGGARSGRRRRAPREAAFALQSVAWGPGNAAPIFEIFDLEGARGEIVALVGRSGSGKSSLLKILGGLEAPREGVAWRAEPRGERSLAAALAMEYPERQLIGRTVAEDVAMALWIEGVPRAERERLAARALVSVGMAPERFALRVPASLSEGEKRRVALAGLLAEPAQLLLLDEPTAGLDPEGRRALRAALGALRERERTVILASHDLDFVHAVADRVIVLAREEGGTAHVVGDGAPGEIFRDAAVLAEAGLPAPDVVILEDALRAAGLLDEASPRDADALVDQVVQGRIPSGSSIAGTSTDNVGAGAA